MLYHAFGPGDITCVAVVPGRAFVLEEVTDFSISSHFDKVPVRRLGHRLPVGWATGGGSIAGTLVCAQFTHGALWKLRRHAGAAALLKDRMVIGGDDDVSRAQLEFFTAGILPQQLPPFHLIFIHTNDAGQMGIARLYHVVLSDVGEVKGAHNLFTEETLQYQALFYEQIRLHRSLTTEQMQELFFGMGASASTTLSGQSPYDEANRTIRQGFFNDPRRPQGLADELLNVLGGEESPDALSYILGETAMLEARLRGEGDVEMATAMAIADQGNIVWAQAQNAEGTLETVGPVTQLPEGEEIDETPNLSLDLAISESYPWFNTSGDGGMTLYTRDVEGTLAIRGTKAYLVDTPGEGATLDAAIAASTSIGAVSMVGTQLRIELTGQAYFNHLTTLTDFGLTQISPLAVIDLLSGQVLVSTTINGQVNATSSFTTRGNRAGFVPAHTVLTVDPEVETVTRRFEAEAPTVLTTLGRLFEIADYEGTYSATGEAFVVDTINTGRYSQPVLRIASAYVGPFDTIVGTSYAIVSANEPPTFQLKLKSTHFGTAEMTIKLIRNEDGTISLVREPALIDGNIYKAFTQRAAISGGVATYTAGALTVSATFDAGDLLSNSNPASRTSITGTLEAAYAGGWITTAAPIDAEFKATDASKRTLAQRVKPHPAFTFFQTTALLAGNQFVELNFALTLYYRGTCTRPPGVYNTPWVFEGGAADGRIRVVTDTDKINILDDTNLFGLEVTGTVGDEIELIPDLVSAVVDAEAETLTLVYTDRELTQ